jgi:hypothetical protein
MAIVDRAVVIKRRFLSLIFLFLSNEGAIGMVRVVVTL